MTVPLGDASAATVEIVHAGQVITRVAATTKLLHDAVASIPDAGFREHPAQRRKELFIGVWRILYMAQIERKEISVYAMDAKPTHTAERIFPCSSSLSTIRRHSWPLCVADTSV